MNSDPKLTMIAVWVLVAMTACHRHDPPAAIPEPQLQITKYSVAPYSSNHLAAALGSNASRTTVLSQFGMPVAEFELGQGITCLTYTSLIAGRDLPDEQHFVGFQVVLSNEMVLEWTPVLTAESPQAERRVEVPERSKGTPAPDAATTNGMTLRLFILSQRPIAKGRRINTDQFPNLGYIAETPDLSVTRILSVERLTEAGGQHRILVELQEADRGARLPRDGR